MPLAHFQEEAEQSLERGVHSGSWSPLWVLRCHQYHQEREGVRNRGLGVYEEPGRKGKVEAGMNRIWPDWDRRPNIGGAGGEKAFLGSLRLGLPLMKQP